MDSLSARSAKGSILVVDDDLSARQTLAALLEGEGYEVRYAPSGQTALLFAGEEPPDLVLLDIRMPDVDGFEVCRRLKAGAGTRSIPVLFVSALEDAEDRVTGFAAGGLDYITKPFHAEEVLARVRTHVMLRRMQASLERLVDERTAALTRSEAALRDRLQFETLLAELSARFVNLPAGQIEDEILRALRSICELLDLDRSVLWQPPPDDPSTLHLTPIDAAAGTEPVVKQLDARGAFPWALAKIRRGETVAIPALGSLPPEAARDLETLRQDGTKATVVVPLKVGGESLGGISFSMAREERAWPDHILRGFRMVADVVANTLVRSRMQAELEARFREIERLKQQLEQENVYLREEVKHLFADEDIVGQSDGMRRILAQVEQVAPTDSTVLISGETGTGKEVIARAVHNLSKRKARTLVTVNCASLPPSLIESELFGRERGAYTGALTLMKGRFEVADGSTLFLDEIGELPLEVQAKLLRVLEEGRFERLGSTKTMGVDVRIIAATNRDLAQDVEAGKFRRDLFYRLNVFPIAIPPLRERLEDIPLLAWAFVREFEKRMGKRIESIPKRTMEAFQRYPWPGNVREVRNVIEHAMIVSQGKVLEVQFPAIAPAESVTMQALREVERKHILAVLENARWRLTGPGGAAERLGMKRTTLQSRMKKLGIARPTS